nr:uncharacterized protein LOC127344475 [Lolium perenne]
MLGVAMSASRSPITAFFFFKAGTCSLQSNMQKLLGFHARCSETDCNPKHDLAEFLANSIIYRYLCSSEDLLQDVLGGMDALAAFGNRMRRDTLTQVVSVRR